jgi:CheY-like chemotaxis protein
MEDVCTEIASSLLRRFLCGARAGLATGVLLSGTVLIVDDDLGTGRLLAMLIRQLGHQAEFVESGGKALEYLTHKKPDVVILDVMMPGIDGMEVLRRMRANPGTADLPVIMFSAMSDPHFRQLAREKGANDYWVKASFDFRSLEQRLATFISPRQQLPN